MSAAPSRRNAPLAIYLTLAATLTCSEPTSSGATYERAHAIEAEEQVFAYARVSPNGRYVAYASEARDDVAPARSQIIKILDLTDARIVFTEPGIDPYWSTTGDRVVFLSYQSAAPTVSILDLATGDIQRDVFPDSLGDYFSWGVKDGKDIVLTILGWYVFLDGQSPVADFQRMSVCPQVGPSLRPLISKDGARVSTFSRGYLAIRSLVGCDSIVETGIPGAKADFSWDGRFIAYHTLKEDGAAGFRIQIYDVSSHRVRNLPDLPGDSQFPSWTVDGRLLFYYDGPGFRGFRFANNVLSLPSHPSPAGPSDKPVIVRWSDVFSVSRPKARTVLVSVWSPASGHAPEMLREIKRLGEQAGDSGEEIQILGSTLPGTRAMEVERMLSRYQSNLRQIRITASGLLLAEAANQNPTFLLFIDGKLVDRRLGTQSAEKLRAWITSRT